MNSLSNTCSEEESALAAQHSTRKKERKSKMRFFQLKHRTERQRYECKKRKRDSQLVVAVKK